MPPISLEDAVQSTATPKADRGVSLDEIYKEQQSINASGTSPGKSALGAVATSVGSSAKETAGKYIKDYSKLANDYSKTLKEDSRANPEGYGEQILQSGKTLMDLVGAATAPMESAARTGIIQPLQGMVDKLSGLVQDHLAADDNYNAQARREGDTSQQYGKGVDWKVHKEDVRRTAEGINKFIESGVLTGVGLIGGKETPVGEVRETSVPPRMETVADPKGDRIEPTVGEIKAPEFKKVGTDALTGKPRMRVVQPEQASAEVSNVMNSVHTEMMDEGPRQSVPGQREGLYGEWDTLHSQMAPIYEKLAAKRGETDTVVGHSSKELLGQMIDNSKPSYVNALLRKIDKHLDDVQIHFVDKVKNTDGTPSKALGAYDYDSEYGGRHQIQVVHTPNEPRMTRTIVHELVHAVSSRFITNNPNHPLVKELDNLRKEAILRADKKEEAVGGWDGHYGFKNVHEFVAESMTNPKFQKFLAKSGKYASGKLKSIFDHFANVVARMLGIERADEAQLLHNSMYASKQLMEAQDRQRFSGGMQTVAHMPSGTPITRSQFNAKSSIPHVSGTSETSKRLRGYVDQLIRSVAPESLGSRAQLAGAVIAARVSERVHRTAVWQRGSETRLSFWKSNPELSSEFIKFYEMGAKFKNPELQKLAESYREWNQRIMIQDLKNGINYEQKDNYLSHVFEDEEGAQNFFAQKYGKKFGDPYFTKDRTFDLYDEAIKAGFKPKYDDPESLMLARQFASDTADMQVNILKDLERYGLASPMEAGTKPPFNTSPRRAPNGDWYHVDNQAYAPLHNYFDTKSLWAAKGIGGDFFRGAMRLKNAIVGPMLSLSGFHFLHVTHIDNADMTSMALKDMLVGQKNPLAMASELLKGIPFGPVNLYKSWIQNPRLGSPLLKAFDGKIPKSELTNEQATQLQYMLEGGFIPKMHDIYRITLQRTFKEMAKDLVKKPWHLPGAITSTLQYPIMEYWIPRLKTASYMRQVDQALKTDPSLHDNPAKRQVALSRIRKSVDNRYGEMAYDTLFWTRWFKDLGVLNTLSLGWNLGFIREYGGGSLDLGQLATRTGQVRSIRQGQLDKPLFVSVYTLTAMGASGLMTYAMTGEPPKDLMDYINPRTGLKNPDGSDERITTMFYTREFAAVGKHVANEGAIAGLTHLVSNKSSGLIGLMKEWATGVNAYGQELRDPDAPAYKQLEQQVAYSMLRLEPISSQALRKQTDPSALRSAMSVAGFQTEPAYMRDSKAIAHIKQAYDLYVAPKQTPYDRVRAKGESAALRSAYNSGDPDFDDKLDAYAEEHKLSNQDKHKLVKSFKRSESADVYMFSRLPWEEQKKQLDAMSQEERDNYLPHSNRKHLRQHYEAPSE